MDFVNEQDSEDPHPLGLLGAGKHFIDIPEGRRGATQRLQRLARQASSNRTNPHSAMLQHVITIGACPETAVHFSDLGFW